MENGSSTPSWKTLENFPARNAASMKSPELPGTNRLLAVLPDLGNFESECIDLTPLMHLKSLASATFLRSQIFSAFK
jgi:hypothetical protein